MNLGRSHDLRNRWVEHLPWIIAGVLLCWPAFYNQFPLLYTDSGTYINSSADLMPPPDRPVGYGYFIRIVTWQASLWPVVIAQGLLMSGLIWRIMRRLLGGGRPWAYAVMMAVLGTVTSLPWFVSEVMPDIFVGAMVLGFSLLVLEWNVRADKALGMLAIFLGCVVHLSHILVGMVLLGMLAVWLLRRKPFAQAWRRWALMALPLAAATLFIVLNMAATGHGYRLSRSSNLFLAARVAETGLLEPFLDMHCATEQYALCGLDDRLPRTINEMIWLPETSPITTYGGWDGADSAMAPIMKAFFRDGANVRAFLWQGGIDAGQLLWFVDFSDGLNAFTWDSAPCIALRWRYPKLLPGFLAAKQQAGALPISGFLALQKPLLWLSLSLICIGLVVGWRRFGAIRGWAFWVMAGWSMNALVLATFASAVARYQPRVSWLLPMIVVLLIAGLIYKPDPRS